MKTLFWKGERFFNLFSVLKQISYSNCLGINILIYVKASFVTTFCIPL